MKSKSLFDSLPSLTVETDLTAAGRYSCFQMAVHFGPGKKQRCPVVLVKERSVKKKAEEYIHQNQPP